jgi:hypothetical protein
MMPATTPTTPTTSRPDIARLGKAVRKRLQILLLEEGLLRVGEMTLVTDSLILVSELKTPQGAARRKF